MKRWRDAPQNRSPWWSTIATAFITSTNMVMSNLRCASAVFLGNWKIVASLIRSNPGAFRTSTSTPCTTRTLSTISGAPANRYLKASHCILTYFPSATKCARPRSPLCSRVITASIPSPRSTAMPTPPPGGGWIAP